MTNVLLAFLGLLCTLTLIRGQGIDQTLIERAVGRDVAEAVIKKISRSGIFTSDQSFMRRVGFVESRFGEDGNTFRPNYYGGIWQVDENKFNATKNLTAPSNLYENISIELNVNWTTVVWQDLLKPLHSGLAARLYLQQLTNSQRPIPGTVALQANYWAQNYRPNGVADNFVELVDVLESDDVICEGLMDICLVLDASGSVGATNFNQAKGFVADLVATFSNETTKVAFLKYGNAAYKIFDFNHTLTSAEMDATIRNTTYPSVSEGTATPAALFMAVDFFLNTLTPRPGVPKVVATFTDGQSNVGVLPPALQAVRSANLTSFAIGIGSSIQRSELVQIALDDPGRVFEVTDFNALAEFFRQMNTVACEVPQEPEVGQNQTGSLRPQEKRYFKFNIPSQGMTFTVGNSNIRGNFNIVNNNNIAVYYSYEEETPNSAVHDGQFVGAGFIPYKEGSPMVYISIQSIANAPIDYVVKTEEGNRIPEEPSTTPTPSTTPRTMPTSTRSPITETTPTIPTTTPIITTTSTIRTTTPNTAVSLKSWIWLWVAALFLNFLQ